MIIINENIKTKMNIENIIPALLEDLKESWEPKTKTEIGYGYHGSRKGDKIEYTMYFDEFRCEWTTKDSAFQGFVFEQIDKYLK